MKNIKPQSFMALAIILGLSIVAGIFIGRDVNSKNTDTSAITTSVTEVKQIGKLEVMTASVQVNRQIFISKKDNVQYASLYTVPGTAVYTVDLSNLEIDCVGSTEDGGYKLLVGIPALETTLMVREDELEKLDEYQKGSFTGSAKEGYEKYLTITKESVAAVEKEISNADGLLSMAKESAKTQIQMLIDSLSIEQCETVLYFL